MKKLALLLALLIALPMCLSSCGLLSMMFTEEQRQALLFGSLITMNDATNGHLERDEIFELVGQNEHALREAAVKIQKGEMSCEDALAELGLEGIGSIGTSGNCVGFDCGGTGIVPEGKSFAFFYTEGSVENEILGEYQGVQRDGDTWLWEQAWENPKGDNCVRVEKIVDGFYYYEEHW